MTTQQVISRNALSKKLHTDHNFRTTYNTIRLYEAYGWLPKAAKIQGVKEVVYTDIDYINLVNTLKKYNKIK